MDFIWFIISTIISGLIIGALGRLAVPGPNPMSIGQTILIGIAGAFIGGLIAFLIGAPVGIAFILEILAAAAIIYFMQRRPNRVL
ncbi:MAG: GlsB/YeaQ/YmgE family stress response membrane protein [Actinomycetota bacterium]|nr:GlsB/YeaQ/YmgE family stress response membrane protein [Actinomycetota bacterium]